MPIDNIAKVDSDDTDFYGKQYWHSHQDSLHYPNVIQRARLDLTERCLYWLNYFLKYTLSPGKVIELGCSHGGFVALLQLLGFQASGLELSQWVVNFAKETFKIPMLKGMIEEQNIEPHSLNAIIMMDVVEHLQEPAKTLKHISTLLNKNGILMIQMPLYQEEKTYQQLINEQSPFLSHLKHDEHLYLFSEQAISTLLNEIDLPYIQFEPAIFSHYDMFLVASNAPLAPIHYSKIEEYLQTTPAGRIVQALLDLYKNNCSQRETIQFIEKDSNARFEQIHQLNQLLLQSEADRAARLTQINTLSSQLQQKEKDYINAQQHIENLHHTLQKLEDEKNAQIQEKLYREKENSKHELIEEHWKMQSIQSASIDNLLEAQHKQAQHDAEIEMLSNELHSLQERFCELEKDRQIKLSAIQNLNQELHFIQEKYKESENDRAIRLESIHELTVQLISLQERYNEAENDRTARLISINKLTDELKTLQLKHKESEEDRAIRINAIEELTAELIILRKRHEESAIDREARLKSINELNYQLKTLQQHHAETEKDRENRLISINNLMDEITLLNKRLEKLEFDSAIHLCTIEELNKNLSSLHLQHEDAKNECKTHLYSIDKLNDELTVLQAQYEKSEKDRELRLLSINKLNCQLIHLQNLYDQAKKDNNEHLLIIEKQNNELKTHRARLQQAENDRLTHLRVIDQLQNELKWLRSLVQFIKKARHFVLKIIAKINPLSEKAE